MKIEIKGRRDLPDLFRLSGIRESVKLEHTPFLVFDVQNEALTVKIVKSMPELLEFADDTQVMVQWKGKFRSDFFHFTVKDLREYNFNVGKGGSDGNI